MREKKNVTHRRDIDKVEVSIALHSLHNGNVQIRSQTQDKPIMYVKCYFMVIQLYGHILWPYLLLIFLLTGGPPSSSFKKMKRLIHYTRGVMGGKIGRMGNTLSEEIQCKQ